MFFSSTFLNCQKNVFTVAFSPVSLGTSKLRFWTRPESPSWTTSARSVLETGTGVIGSKDDESGNAFHLIQATSGIRPTRKANGGFLCNATALYTNAAIGAWSGDFDVWAVVKYNTMQNDYRVMEVNSDTGLGLLQATPDKVRFSVANSTAPYGLASATALSSIHILHGSRVGTTATIQIDSATAATQTVTGSAIANTPLYVGLSYLSGVGANVDHHEIAVCAGLTSGERSNMNTYFANRLSSGIYY